MASGQGLRNPESDSFAYMETLLESLAVLSKLGSALDIVGQRLPGEIFSLVETTLAEVGERAEYGRRGSMFAALSGTGALKSDAMFVFPSGNTTGSVGMSTSVAPKGGFLNASTLRLAALESSSKRVDHETLKDFFWTVYSKLDAVTQGLRVVYEVSNRIGSVCLHTILV
jgi:exocyst complex component 4